MHGSSRGFLAAAAISLAGAGCTSPDATVIGPKALGCPAMAPHEGDPCDGPERITCSWDGTPCGCYTDPAGQMRWVECGSTRQALGANCPAQAPAEGSSCADSANAYCDYNGTICACSPSGVWSCPAPDADAGRPTTGTQPLPPPTVTGSTRVSDLTDAQARSWCDWYLTNWTTDGGATIPQYESNGSVTGGATNGCIGTGFWASGCVQSLLPDYCVRNLRLNACDATVDELNDCVGSILDGCIPSGRGCGPFFGHSSCAQTIVQRPADETCAVPLAP